MIVVYYIGTHDYELLNSLQIKIEYCKAISGLIASICLMSYVPISANILQ